MGLFEKPVEYFGVDVGTSGIRLVQLKKGSGKPTLATYGHVAIDSKVASSDSPIDISKVAATVKQLVKDAKVSVKNVIAGVPSTKVFATVITTPKISGKDLDKALRLQADQYIPMPLKDVKLDWYILGQGAKPDEQEVLLVAAPNTVAEKYVSLFDQAGLELLALEPNAIALARAVVQPSDLAVLLLDIGSVTSDITIVQANMPKLLRSVNIGGQTFMKSVAQNLGLDDAQADQFTKKFGLTQTKLEGQVAKAIKPSLDQLVGEIQKSVKFFTEKYPDVKLEKAIITGGAVAMPELPANLASAIGLSVEIANPWVKVSYPAQLQDTLMGLGTSYGTAVGLAERDSLV